VALLEVERRQQYLDKMRGEAEVLRPLVEECLDDDPAVRPTITAVCERIQVSKDVYKKESLQDVITLCQQVEQQKTLLRDVRVENEMKMAEIDVQINQLYQQVEKQKIENDRLRKEINQVIIENDQLKFEVDQLNQQLVSVILLSLPYMLLLS